jgi:hypothetical protein
MFFCMTDPFLYYVVSIAFVCVMTGLLLVYRYFLGNRLTQQAAKLKSQMANIKQYYPQLEGGGQQFVSNAIGEIGIEGILDELGVPKPFQGIAKGFIEGIMNDPKKIQALADKFGVKIPNGNDVKSQETDLL